ncbi:hypothetical protein BGZ63DRAFT_385587 [Mariannaea sp. PMI_226]|nr:hypothetical protein BGZ63DRAFT_385587 [Mariannaea sp. PMI_226]
MPCHVVRATVAGNALRPTKKPSRILDFVMSTGARDQLWKPNSGIRFYRRTEAPKVNTQVLYPSLDVNRFVHTANIESPAIVPKISPDLGQFSDDEQFEQDMVEWCNQNDALLMSTPTPVQKVTRPESHHALSPQGVNATVKPDIVTSKVESEAKKLILPPVTSLDYTMSNDLFQAALKSKVGSFQSYWSHALYRHAHQDGSVHSVKVHYCTSKHTMEEVCKKYFLGEKVLGFDMEWMAYASASAGPRQNVSLIQIASPSRIALFQTALFENDDFVAPTFRAIMEDEGVSKVGINILADCTRLRNYLKVETSGIFELSHLYKLVKYTKLGQPDKINKSIASMAVQVQEVLRLPMYKGPSVRSSNWMRRLNDAQIKYSAADAYAGIQLYYVLEHERENLSPCPPRPEFAEKRMPIKLAPPPEIDAEVPVEVAKTDVPDKVTDITEEPPLPTLDSVPASVLVPRVSTSKDNIPTTTTTTTTTSSKSTTPSKAIDSRIVAANLELQLYRSQRNARLVAKPSAMRSYFIWYNNQDLTPDSIAKLLRDPPLKTNTVVSYILESITLEKVSYSKERLKTEVLSFLDPQNVMYGKYRDLFKEAYEIKE